MKILIVILILFFIVVITWNLFGTKEGFWSINLNTGKQISSDLTNYKKITVSPNAMGSYPGGVSSFAEACANKLGSTDNYDTMIITKDDRSETYSCYVGNVTTNGEAVLGGEIVSGTGSVDPPVTTTVDPPVTVASVVDVTLFKDTTKEDSIAVKKNLTDLTTDDLYYLSEDSKLLYVRSNCCIKLNNCKNVSYFVIAEGGDGGDGNEMGGGGGGGGGEFEKKDISINPEDLISVIFNSSDGSVTLTLPGFESKTFKKGSNGGNGGSDGNGSVSGCGGGGGGGGSALSSSPNCSKIGGTGSSNGGTGSVKGAGGGGGGLSGKGGDACLDNGSFMDGGEGGKGLTWDKNGKFYGGGGGGGGGGGVGRGGDGGPGGQRGGSGGDTGRSGDNGLISAPPVEGGSVTVTKITDSSWGCGGGGGGQGGSKKGGKGAPGILILSLQ